MGEHTFPILDLYNRSLNIPSNLIEEVRQKFLERVAKDPQSYYDEDVQRVKSDDWMVRRFLYRFKSDPDANKGLESLDKAMKWRKSFGVHDFKETDIAREMYLSAAMIFNGKDKNGSPLLIVRGKCAKKSKTWRPYFDKVLVYHMENVDQNNTGKGLTVLMDSRDTSLKNVDMDALKFLHILLDEYYPGILNATIIFKMPAVLETVYKVFKSWLNEEQNKYIYLAKKKNINDYVAVDQLPDLLNGTNTTPYRVVPEGSTSIHSVANKYGIKKEKADKMLKFAEKHYQN